MTDEQKQRISAALAELESAVNEAWLSGELWMDLDKVAKEQIGGRTRFIYRINLRFTQEEILWARKEGEA